MYFSLLVVADPADPADPAFFAGFVTITLATNL
jgi:hypothetical protein